MLIYRFIAYMADSYWKIAESNGTEIGEQVAASIYRGLPRECNVGAPCIRIICWVLYPTILKASLAGMISQIARHLRFAQVRKSQPHSSRKYIAATRD